VAPELLSRVDLRAPFGGTIERRAFSVSERVQTGDTLFVLADTRLLWVKAEIRESDWPAVSLCAGQPLRVSIPAVNQAELEGTVEYVGREVSSETNAIPIVARIGNAAGHLRPGLFARARIPMGAKNDVLTVPVQAVLQHEDRSFVFVAESDTTFRRADVATGVQSEGHVEIVRGLRDGERVVSEGAFFLKSELLLEGMEE
jgi:cobalt-zinc-cadmium efflux system membrane fusion protein